MTIKKLIGIEAEKLARHYLQELGYQVIAHNYFSRYGEIDLICRNGSTLIFIEVKMRRTNGAGEPESAITKAKQKKMYLTAIDFLQKYVEYYNEIQFEAVSVGIGRAKVEVVHFKNIIEDVA